MLERNRSGAAHLSSAAVKNVPLPADTLAKMRDTGTRMAKAGFWRGDISQALVKLDPERRLDDLYL